MGLSGSDPARIGSWLRDLSFAEAHAMLYGAAHGLGIAVAHALGYTAVAIGLIATAGVLLGWTSTERTKDLPLVASILGSIPTSIKGQIRGEKHYYAPLLVVSALVTHLVVSAGVLPL